MDRSDLKVGGRYKGGNHIRRVLYIGEKKVLFCVENTDTEDSYSIDFFLENHEPVKEQPELFYKWRIKSEHSGNWHVWTFYLNKNGISSGGHKPHYSEWDNTEKHILKEFNPIDKEGIEVPWSEIESD